jgi:hypothetical protein
MIAVSRPVMPLSSLRIVFANLFNILPPYQFDAICQRGLPLYFRPSEISSQFLIIPITSL